MAWQNARWTSLNQWDPLASNGLFGVKNKQAKENPESVMRFFHKRPTTVIALMHPSHSWSTRSGCFDNYQNRLIMCVTQNLGDDSRAIP